MNSVVFFGFFILLAFAVLALLSILSSSSREKITLPSKITSVDSELIKNIKNKYHFFIEALLNKNSKFLKEICTTKFFKKLNLKTASCEKIACILSANVLKVDGVMVEIEFISRSIHTDILYNKCTFLLTNNSFKLDSVTI